MITLIAAIGKNNELGKNNDLLWHLPGDLKFFKKTTLNHTVIMGYKTYESIGRPLPERRNVVLSNKDVKIDNIVIYTDMDEMIKNEIKKDEETFIIGGASMYNYFYPLADRMYLTIIDAECPDAEVYFPKINDNEWEETILYGNEDNGIKYTHILYERIK